MRTARVAIVVACLLCGIGTAPQPAVATPATTVCHYSLDNAFTPGLSLTPGKGTYSSTSGTITCLGTIKGQHPVGSGDVRTWGSYGASSPGGDTCLGIAGTGARYVLTLPTVEGSVTVEDVFSWQVGSAPGGTGVPAVGTWNGETSSGPAFLVTPALGDCVTSPLTVAHLEGVGLFPA